jgi:hypothetical protein
MGPVSLPPPAPVEVEALVDAPLVVVVVVAVVVVEEVPPVPSALSPQPTAAETPSASRHASPSEGSERVEEIVMVAADYQKTVSRSPLGMANQPLEADAAARLESLLGAPIGQLKTFIRSSSGARTASSHVAPRRWLQ